MEKFEPIHLGFKRIKMISIAILEIKQLNVIY